MNDSLKYNREVRKGRKSLKDILTAGSAEEEPDHINKDDVKERVRLHLQREKRHSAKSRIFSVTLLGAIIIGAIGTYFVFKNAPERFPKPENSYFITRYHKKKNKEQLRVDYYDYARKAAETRYKKGKKHQNSISYYPSGQQFRSALYYYDSLIIDMYFFKNGDTIKNFPKVPFDKVYHIEIPQSDSMKIAFDYLDGKIIYDSYTEKKL
ncbi:hypothetical protein [Fulvivirga ligni]|uniref:hypothetical protein n=1 Tax=Fulvivirga ligni TaxID=2904246 RepID=UPI001F2D8417|nr:hypothetical protein [Fulvivirga ligni]UII20901.1 hypothetical protein LVD16_23955 [Fulvivirga ligni]